MSMTRHAGTMPNHSTQQLHRRPSRTHQMGLTRDPCGMTYGAHKGFESRCHRTYDMSEDWPMGLGKYIPLAPYTKN